MPIAAVKSGACPVVLCERPDWQVIESTSYDDEIVESLRCCTCGSAWTRSVTFAEARREADDARVYDDERAFALDTPKDA